MISDECGPDKPCRRTACIEANAEKNPGVQVGAHLGGEHLNPHNRALFDGNASAIRATTYRVRESVSVLHRATRADPALALLADVAIHDVLKEIDNLSQQVAHARMDADRQVRHASARALSCDAHGKTIADLERQAAADSERAERNDKARLALLGFLTAVDQLLEVWREGGQIGRERPSAPQIIGALKQASKKTHAAHSRVWSSRS